MNQPSRFHRNRQETSESESERVEAQIGEISCPTRSLESLELMQATGRLTMPSWHSMLRMSGWSSNEGPAIWHVNCSYISHTHKTPELSSSTTKFDYFVVKVRRTAGVTAWIGPCGALTIWVSSNVDSLRHLLPQLYNILTQCRRY